MEDYDKENPFFINGSVGGEWQYSRRNRAKSPEELENDSDPGQHQAMHVLHADILAEAR